MTDSDLLLSFMELGQEIYPMRHFCSSVVELMRLEHEEIVQMQTYFGHILSG